MIRKRLHKKTYIVYSVTIVKWLYDAFSEFYLFHTLVIFQQVISYHLKWYGVVM